MDSGVGGWACGSVGDGGTADRAAEAGAGGDAGPVSPTPPHAGGEREGGDSHTAETAATRRWRLVEPGAAPRPGADNMAIDRVLAESVEAGGPPALRFYY